MAPASRGGHRANRLRGALVVGQITFSVALLVGAALLLRSFVTLVRTDAGYDPGSVLTAQVSFPRVGMTKASRDQFVTTLVDRLRAQPESARPARPTSCPSCAARRS